MANFIKLEESYLPSDGDWYKVTGVITEEDIQKINSLPRKTILVIENTKGLSSDTIRKITSSNISFSVVGGLDYFNKEKYKRKEYIARTMMSVPGLSEIISYYENIESKMNPEWTDTQKCMFLYDALARDFTYEENYETQIAIGIAERSLNGILYKKLVCAGFAMVLKEGLDRIGINNIYQNQRGHHSWNIVELDGKLRGLELTWDCYNKGSDNICQFKYFGQDHNFYENKSHQLSREVEDIGLEGEIKTTTVYEEETQYDLTPFTVDELIANYRVIAPAINSRTVNQTPLFNNLEEEIKLLPLDSLRVRYQKQSAVEQKYIMLYKFLKSSGKLNADQFDFLNLRSAYISDVIGTLPSSLVSSNTSYFNGNDIGLESMSNCEFHTNGAYYTPFGVKRIVAQQETENITDENEINKLFTQLQQRLNDYSVSYLIELLNNSEAMLENYRRIHNMKVNKDLNLELVEADLYTKLQSLITSKELLVSNGLSKDVIQQRIGNIESYFNFLKQQSLITEEEQKKNDLDFLLGVLGDTNEVRKICEQYDGHQFSDEEWKQKCTNVEYMMQVFDKLGELNIKKENIQIALNELFSNKYEITEEHSGIKR